MFLLLLLKLFTFVNSCDLNIFTMINIEDFIKRLEIILEYYSISASSFADTIGVQRSALSHLLSGRNKPSLDFVMRINESYPDVDLYWLLNGMGNFPSHEKPKNDGPLPSPVIEIKSNESLDLFSVSEPNSKEDKKTENINDLRTSMRSQHQEDKSLIDRIVIFYKDGTFKSYNEL